MNPTPDVLVVGGGVIGICTAYELTGLGFAVTLVDQAEIAAGSSKSNAGLIVPSHAIPLPRPGVLAQGLRWMLDPASPLYVKPRLDPALLSWLWHFRKACSPARMQTGLQALVALGRASQGLYTTLIAQEELACDYQEAGLLLLYRTATGFEEGRAEAAILEGVGVLAQILDAEAVQALEPTTRPDITGGVYLAGDAHLDPEAFVRELANRVEARGGAVRQHTRVTGFSNTGGRVDRVRTTRGAFTPGQVVLATGAWSSQVARDLNLALPVQPAKGYSLTYQKPQASPRIPLLLAEDRVAVTPLGSWLRFAGTLEFVGMDLAVNPRRVAAIREAPSRYLALDKATLEQVESWRGLRPMTPDGLPLIGRPPGLDNVIVATGHAMLGMSLGPVTGRLVSQLAAGQPPLVDLHPFRVDRF